LHYKYKFFSDSHVCYTCNAQYISNTIVFQMMCSGLHLCLSYCLYGRQNQVYKEFYLNKSYIFFKSTLSPGVHSYCRRILYNLINKFEYIIKLAVLNSSLGFLFSAITAMNEKMCNIKVMFIRNKLHHAIWLNRWISMLQGAFHFIQCGNLNKIWKVILHKILYGPYLITRDQRVLSLLSAQVLFTCSNYVLLCYCLFMYLMKSSEY